MKVVELEACWQCRHYSKLTTSSKKNRYCHRAERRMERRSSSQSPFPSWCPLEDLVSIKDLHEELRRFRSSFCCISIEEESND